MNFETVKAEIFQPLGSGYPLGTLTLIPMGAQTNLGARKTGGEAYSTLEMESSTVSIEGLTIVIITTDST